MEGHNGRPLVVGNAPAKGQVVVDDHGVGVGVPAFPGGDHVQVGHHHGVALALAVLRVGEMCIRDSSMADSGAAHIDNETCISCGACVYQCPFGAIVDKSFILDVVDMIKKSDHNENYKLYAVVAPSISSQFSYAKLGQVITGIQELGFFHVVEAALRCV